MKKILSTAAVLTLLGWTAPVQAISITLNSPTARAATAITSWAGAGSVALPQGGIPPGVPVMGVGILRQPGFDNSVATWAFASMHRPRPNGLRRPPANGALPPQALPEGGTTGMMFGAAFSGLALFRRKMTLQ